MQCSKCGEKEAVFPSTLCGDCRGNLWYEMVKKEKEDTSKPAMTHERVCQIFDEITQNNSQSNPNVHPKPSGIYG